MASQSKIADEPAQARDDEGLASRRHLLLWASPRRAVAVAAAGVPAAVQRVSGRSP
jgi:hypothetical protein